MPLHSETATLRSRRHFLSLLAAGASGPLVAATPDAQKVPELEGTEPRGQRLGLSGLRGRVVLVFYWSTGCAVCRDKMRELRLNLTGWSGQPFTLLGVNMDARQQDFIGYETLVRQTVPAAQQFSSLWAGSPGFRDTMGKPEQLPSARLIDKQGRLVERYNGRIPPEAWDRISELL